MPIIRTVRLGLTSPGNPGWNKPMTPRFRSPVPIYAMTRHIDARQRMCLFRDVYPVAFDPQGSGATHAARLAVKHASPAPLTSAA